MQAGVQAGVHPGPAAGLQSALRQSLLARRLAPTHGLWLGPDGLWDFGALPGWRPWGNPAGLRPVPRRHAGFDAWCQSHPGHGASLILSAWLLHELLLDPLLPLRDDSARLRYARNLLLHHHGELAIHWPLTAWNAGGRHGVSALHALSLQALQASARQSGVSLRSVRPWWSLALALALQQAPQLASADSSRLLVVDAALVTLIDLSRGRLVQLQQRRLASASPHALQALHAGLPSAGWCGALGHGLATPWQADAHSSIDALGALHGDAPASLWFNPASAPARLAA